MTKAFGAVSRSRASTEPAARLGPAGFDRGEEAWLPALIAFYRADCSFMRAESLSKGWRPLDGTDLRTIEALRAAIEVAP